MEELSQNMSLSDLEVKYHTMKGETEHTIIALLASYKERVIDAGQYIQKLNQENVAKDAKIQALESELAKFKNTSDKPTEEKKSK
jgi:hypothetical protein